MSVELLFLSALCVAMLIHPEGKAACSRFQSLLLMHPLPARPATRRVVLGTGLLLSGALAKFANAEEGRIGEVRLP
jgi:hypothetical protein